MRSLKVILLPILGIFAAVLAFRLASPFENTLSRPELGIDDPRTFFTYGTAWGEVNRIAFGSLICGPFTMILTLGRRSLPRVVLATVLGALLGGVINFATDSGADLIGLSLSHTSVQIGSLVAMLAWCALVPLGISMAITIALGITEQRLKRAFFAARIAAMASFFVQIVGGVLASPDPSADNLLQSQIPVWRTVEMAVGLALGVTILVADEWIRSASLRLMQGKNEFRDWSIDYSANRIGSSEGCEIPLFGQSDVAPIHATIYRTPDAFTIDAHAPTLVNGQPVTQGVLRSGDQIEVGNAQLVFTIRGVAPVQLQNLGAAIPATFPPIPVGRQNILVDGHGRQLPLPPGKLGVGRDNHNALCLFADPQVAGHHADFISSQLGLELLDHGSPFGTKVNGQPVNGSRKLTPGDVVEFGTSRFTYYQ